MAISVFDLFKIGIGPSSSHTVGPMRAAALFVQGLRERDQLPQVRRIEVQLYGSLSATGVGHGSDNAVIMGLMGEWPDAIDPSQIGPRMTELHDSQTLLLDGYLPIPFVWSNDMRLIDENLPFHPNAMTLIAEDLNGELGQAEEFDEKVYPVLTRDLLQGRRIALVAFGNLTDYGSNLAFVEPYLAGELQ